MLIWQKKAEFQLARLQMTVGWLQSPVPTQLDPLRYHPPAHLTDRYQQVSAMTCAAYLAVITFAMIQPGTIEHIDVLTTLGTDQLAMDNLGVTHTAAPWGAMDLKRKRDGFLDNGADIIQFLGHACHFWIANNFSTDMMSWYCSSMDNWDNLQSFQMDLFRPFHVFEGLSDGLPNMLSRPGLGVSDFSTNALQVAPGRPWHDKLNYERKGSYRKWICAVSLSSVAFEVVMQQVLSGPMVCTKGGPAEFMSESLETKSSSSFHSRLGQFLKVLQFYADEGSRVVLLEEYCIYNYVKSVADTAPSYPGSSMQPVGFATHVFGLIGGLDVYSSRRIDGAVKVRHVKLVRVRQLPPLTAGLVTTWAGGVAGSDKSVYDRVIAGYVLGLLYGRFRFLDGHCFTAMCRELVHVDSKPARFLVCSDECTKTTISLEHKRRCLRVCIPVQCLTGPAWFFGLRHAAS